MKSKKIIIIIVAVILAAAIAAAGIILFKNKGNTPEAEPTAPTECEIEAPGTYEIDEVTVQAFPVGPDIQVMLEKTEEDDTPADESTAPTGDEVSGGVHVQAIYGYRDISEVWERVKDYCRMLMREDIGFVPVDEANMETELPFINTSGSVRLARQEETEEENKNWIFSLQMDWDTDGLNVILSKIDGIVQQPPETEQTAPEKDPITMAEAMEIFYDCKPSELQLEGDNMRDYDVIILDGSVIIGEEPFMRVNVYEKDQKDHTNIIAGMYFLSSTGEKMYRVDLNDSIYPISFTQD